MMKYVIGVDIGGTFIRIGIVNESLEVFESAKLSVSTVLKGSGIKEFNQFIIEYFEKYKLNYNIIGLQMGFPGIVDQKLKSVISVPNRHEFEGSDYLKELEINLHIPVLIDKDVNHLLAFDLKANHLDETSYALGFYIGTGFGNAIKLMGQIYRGENGLSGEIGHIPVYGVEKTCGCGNIGCLETVASGKHLVEIVNEFFQGLPLEEIFTVAKNDPKIQKFIENIAMAIATEINILDVSTIIIGGGVTSMKDFPKDLLMKYLFEKIRSKVIKDKINIIYSTPSDISGIVGAAILAFPLLIGVKHEN